MSLPAAIGLPRPRAAALARIAWLALPAIATLALAAQDGGSQTGDWMPWALVAVLSAGGAAGLRHHAPAPWSRTRGARLHGRPRPLERALRAVGLAAGRRRHRGLAHALLRLRLRDRAAGDTHAARRRDDGRADRDGDRPRHALRLRAPRPGGAGFVDDLQARRLADRLSEHVRVARRAGVLDARRSRRRAAAALARAFARARRGGCPRSASRCSRRAAVRPSR